MASILSVINDNIRYLIDDPNKSRFTDEALLAFFKIALSRTQAIGYARKLSFLRKSQEFNILANDDSIVLPDDFMVQSSLWNGNREIKLITEEEYDGAVYARPLSCYIVEGDKIVLLTGADEDTSLKLRYYSDIKVDSLTLASPMPWSDKLNYPVSEYVKVRALNVDRYNTTVDAQLMSDLDSLITDIYIDLDPTTGEAQGAF